MQDWFNIQKSINVIHVNSLKKKKNHMIISIYTEKAFDKIQHSFVTKNSQQTRNSGELLNLIKNIHKKPTPNIILKGEKLKAFLLRSETIPIKYNQNPNKLYCGY